MFPGMKPREGFTMKMNNVHLTRPDLHILAAELGITTRDVLINEGVLTIYNTSETCQEIVDDNALVSFVAMVFSMPAEDITEFQSVVEEIKPLFDPSDFIDEDEDDL